MLRCKDLGLSLPELDLITIGDVIDLLTEKMNDNFDYPVQATQEDFDSF